MLACVYVETKDEEAAIEAYKRAIALKPDLVEAHNNLGVIYKNREQFELAAECFQVVVRLDPKSSYALSNLGNVLKDAGYMDKAIKTLKRAIESDNYLASAYSNLLMALNYLPELTPEEIFQQHQEWGSHVPASIQPERFELSERRTKLAKKEKLRLGFVSPDLHMHSVAYFVDAIFSSLDRNRFELFVYYNNDRHDAVQQRFQEQADAWFDVKELNEESLANKVYQDEN